MLYTNSVLIMMVAIGISVVTFKTKLNSPEAILYITTAIMYAFGSVMIAITDIVTDIVFRPPK